MTDLQHYDVTLRVLAQDFDTALETARDDMLRLEETVINIEPVIFEHPCTDCDVEMEFIQGFNSELPDAEEKTWYECPQCLRTEDDDSTSYTGEDGE